MSADDRQRPHLSWGGSTHVGRVREINQDALHAEAGLFAVADGMGGHQGGEVAAQLAVDTLAGSVRRNVDELVAAVEAANQAVHQRGADDPDLSGMGTTVVSLAVVDADHATYAALASVGDSRIYRWRDGELEQLTVDHNYVAEMVDRGQLSLDAAATHPYRNMLTRAIGVERDVSVDARVETLVAGDRYLLCSDGLTNEISDDEIGDVLSRLRDPSEAARELVRVANEAGGRDNVTALVVDVDDAPPPAEGELPVTEPLVIAGEPVRSTSGTGWVDQLLLPTLAVVGLLVVAGSLLGWYARNAYFVTYDADEVTIQQGRPGGLLWFSPTIEHRTGIFRDELAPDAAAAVDGGPETATYSGARVWIDALELTDGPTPAEAVGAGTDQPGSTPTSTVPDGTTPASGSPASSATSGPGTTAATGTSTSTP